MSARAPKACNAIGCPELVRQPTRYCPTHAPAHQWQGVDTNRTGTAAHKARRVRVLKRDGHRCQIRYDVCIGIATHLDHVISLGQGGADADDNCVAACQPCHARKSSAEGHAARGHHSMVR
jgi:5-methylcytosine-specific restriction protein A